MQRSHCHAEGGCSSLYIALRGTTANDRFIACQTLQRLSVQRAIGLPASHGTVTHVDVCGCRQNDFPHSLVAFLVSRVNTSNAKRRLENVGLDDDESDVETICYFGSDGSDESVNLSSDELSSESDAESDSDSEALADVRVWCAIDLQNCTTMFPVHWQARTSSFPDRLQRPAATTCVSSSTTM